MGGRPAKFVAVIEGEGVNHMTKAEKRQRRNAERAMLTGKVMNESPATRKNESAHKAYRRLKVLMREIGMDDALFERPVNRFCQILAECEHFGELRKTFEVRADELEERYSSGDSELDEKEYYRTLAALQKALLDVDRRMEGKRNQLLAIERELGFTPMSAARMIPKRVEDESEDDPMSSLLAGRS